MAGQWARFLCTISLVMAGATHAWAGTPPLLTQEQLKEPAQVSAWLVQHAATADKEEARQAAQEGMAALARGDRGAALKGLGYSAQLYPTPQALKVHADTVVRFLGGLRTARKDRAVRLARDLASFEALYRTVLASDAVLPSLSAEQRGQIQADVDCLAAYRRQPASVKTCAPLVEYGLMPAPRQSP